MRAALNDFGRALGEVLSAFSHNPIIMNIQRHLDIAHQSWNDEQNRPGENRKLAETAFLPAALEILETPPSPIGRTILAAMMAFLMIAMAWAFIGKVDEIAVAPGKLIPRGEVKVIQAADYGVVRAIRVFDGQAVKKGQPLIVLDPTASRAEAEQARRSLLVARTDETRARVLADFDRYGVADLALPQDLDEGIAETQRRLVSAKVREHKAAHDSLVQQIAQHRGDLLMVEAEIAKLKAQLPLAQAQYESFKRLSEAGAAPRIQMMEVQERAIGVEQDLLIRQAEAKKMRAAVADGAAELVKLDASFRREALDSLNEAEAAVALRSEELKKAVEKSALTILAAPVDGKVQQLAVHTLGAVVKPADALMVVVPDNAELIVEAKVLNKDAGFVREGQPVEVKLEAFPFTRYGVVPATLESISHDAIEDKENGLVYIARAKLSHNYIDAEGVRTTLVPGLSATAEIKTGDRRIIDYLLSPLARRVAEAGRER